MIDPSIITRGAERAQMQQQQNFESLGELGNSIGRMVLGRRINTLQQLGTPEEKQAYANKSIYAPQLNAQIKADKAAALQAQMVQQKHAADIGNTNAQAAERNSNVGKNIQQGVGYGLDNSGKLLAAANQALYVGTQSGDPNAVKLALNNAKKAGYFDSNPEAYNQYVATVEELSAKPEELKSFALNLQKAYAQNPEKYNFTTADNQLDNATTQRGQDISAETSRYGTDVSANTADKNRVQQGQQFSQNLALNQQKQYFEQNKPISFQTGNDGYQYAVYANGKGVKVLGDDGQPIKVQTKNANTNVPKIAELQGDNDTLNNTIASLNRAKNLSQKGIYDGALSSTRADIAGTFGGTEESRRTQEYNNIVMSNALSSLKATFGSSPTEGERAILLKIQASSDYPPEVRAKILDEAIAVAQKKIESNKGQMGTLGGVSQQAAQPQVGNKPPIASFFE